MKQASEWRAVPEWDHYLVSNIGSVYNSRTKKMLAPDTNGRVCLSDKKSGCRAINVGNLVLEAFVGLCPDEMECCHNDDNRTNNRLDNLRWDTHQSNLIDAYRNGGMKPKSGERNGNSVLTEGQVLEAIQLKIDGWIWNKLASRYNVSFNTIWNAVKGVTWKHLHRKEG